MVLMSVDTEQGIADGSIKNIKQYDLIDAILVREYEENLSRKYVGLDNIVASLWLGSDNNWYFTERLFKNEIINLSKVYKLSYDCNFDDVIKSFMNYCLHWIDDIAGWTHNLRISLKSATEDDDLAIYE